MLHTARRVAASAAAAVSSSAQSPLPRRTAACAAGACTHLVLPLRQSAAHQQRRLSSSSSSSSSKKPSAPASSGSSSGGATTTTAAAASARQPVRAGEADAPAGKAVRGAAAAAEEDGALAKTPRKARQQKLPSVPSTQHIPAEFIGLSAFFSMHRPMSITQSLPKTISDEHFASIFAVKPARRKQQHDPAGVISTLSQTVDSLEGPMARLRQLDNVDADAADDADHGAVRKFDITYASGAKARVVLGPNFNSTATQFLPYTPPPVPEPEVVENSSFSPTGLTIFDGADEEPSSPSASSATAATTVEGDARPQPMRRYQAMFTVVETRDPDGQLSAYVHDPQILHEGEGIARTFLERMALRQLRSRLRQARELEERRAISVKRQKKLKMKKKKYKKLQRRLKLEKRKLERN